MATYEIRVDLPETFETEQACFAKARHKKINIINYQALTSQRPLIR